MRKITHILILLVSSISFGQVPDAGYFSEMKSNKVKSVKEYSVNFYEETPDTNLLNYKFFNEFGYLMREEFKGYLNQDYFYDFQYNSKGFIIQIDSVADNKVFKSSSNDTVVNREIITWEHLPNNVKREKKRISIWYDELIGDSTKTVYEYTYNNFGKKTRVLVDHQDFKMTVHSISIGEYLYNKQDMLVEERLMDSQENVVMKTIYVYEYY